MESLLVLPHPPPNGFSPNLVTSIDQLFKTSQDLSKAPSISSAIKKDYADTDRALTTLQKTLSSLTSQWASRSNLAKSLLYQLHRKFQHFGLTPSSDVREPMLEEMAILVKELHRIEVVQGYVETTLNLELLVGDLEDAVICVMNQKGFSFNDFESKYEKVFLCIRGMNDIEDILARNCSQWCNLLKAVDGRVDRSLGSLRLQALADHRVILSKSGWPPSLLASEGGSELVNPLVRMRGDIKKRYSQSFLALCSLQRLHTRREERKCSGLGRKTGHRYGLWGIDELVSPIALRTEHHFLKWFDQPEFVFALVHKIIKDFVLGVDDVLQPLIDKARLAGCSAKEDWVWAMANMLMTYLRKKVFPVLADRYREKRTKKDATSSWLHLVDHIIAFDKRINSLTGLGTDQNLRDSVGFLEGISLLSIFGDQPDWLKTWAKIELKDALKKLNFELEDTRAWMSDNKVRPYAELEAESFALSSREDHKAPFITEAVVKITRRMIERCQSVPTIFLRIQFIRSSPIRFLWHFFNILIQRCNKSVYMVTCEDEDELMKVCMSINAARYCEFVLREWSDDVNFIEMKMTEADSKVHLRRDHDDHCCFFWEEVKFLMKFETDWTVEIMADVLRQFETLSCKYILDTENWVCQREGCGANPFIETTIHVSIAFLEPLEALRNQLHVFKKSLNSKDFLYLWRSIADGLDQFTFSSIVMSGAIFSDHGVNQFLADMQALFLVFQPFCARPEAFFPYIKDTLSFFKLDLEGIKHLLSLLDTKGKRRQMLQVYGFSFVSPVEAEKILRSRKFGV